MWELFDLNVGAKSSGEVNSTILALFILKIESRTFCLKLRLKKPSSTMGIFVSGNSTLCCNFLVPAEALEVLVCGMGNQKMESTEAKDLCLIERNYWNILGIPSIHNVFPKALPG